MESFRNISLKPLLLLFFILFPTSMHQSTYHTPSTQCELQLEITHHETNGDHISVQKCLRRDCQAYHINGVCKQWQFYVLEERKCLLQCCGASYFNQDECEEFNKSYQKRNNTSIHVIIGVLLASISILLVASLIFIVKYLKCCKKSKEYNECTKKTKKISFDDDKICWKKCQFEDDHECQQCKIGSAFIRLPCTHYFHLECLDSFNWCCPECCLPICKLKLFCISCLQYSVIVTAESKEQLQNKIGNRLFWHSKSCYKNINFLLSGSLD